MIPKETLDFIKEHEGLRLNAYKDTKGIWTIGWGTTKYPNGFAVRERDIITKEEAQIYLETDCEWRLSELKKVIRVILNQNQWTAILSISYNIGIPGIKGSTFLRIINTNPKDPAIRPAILMWNKETINGKKVPNKGLTNRRNDEADLYFKPI